MIRINWDDYKEFKIHSSKKEKLDILIDFLKSYYNLTNPADIYASLANDGLGQMMLEKHDISDDEAMENYIFRQR
ncbi:MAG: hypothetical protein ABFQ64_00760 [Campylobacterota bacterium]